MRTLHLVPLIVAAAITLGSSAPARASIAAMDFTTAGNAFPGFDSGSGGTGGWAFTVLSKITVEGLGIWDEGANGLNSGHDVGLWKSDGTLLLSTIVDNTSTPVASTFSRGQWLFDSVTPLELEPGDYVVGAYYANNDPDRLRSPVPVTIP